MATALPLATDFTGASVTEGQFKTAITSFRDHVNEFNLKGASIASSATTDIGAATSEFVDITGTTAITAFGTVAAGTKRVLRFTGSLTITHNATSLICPNSVDLITAANDVVELRSLGSGNWIVTDVNRPRIKTAAVSFTRDTSLASGTQAITGVGFRPSSALFFMAQDVSQEMSVGFSDTSRTGQVVLARTSNFVTAANIAIFAEQTTTDHYYGSVSSWDADGCTITWTRTGVPTGTIIVKALFFL